MKNLGPILLTVGLALLTADFVKAQCRATYRPAAYVAPVQAYQQYNHNAYSYQAPIVASLYYPQQVHQYQGVGYVQFGYTDTQGLERRVEKLEVGQLNLKIDQLTQQVQRLTSPAFAQPNPQQPQPQPLQDFSPAPPKKLSLNVKGHPAEAIMARSCSSCHSETTAKGKGGSFVIFVQDGIANLSRDQWASIGDEVYAGTMPPGKGLKDEDVGQLMDYIRLKRKK